MISIRGRMGGGFPTLCGLSVLLACEKARLLFPLSAPPIAVKITYPTLPVSSRKEEILAAMRQAQVVVVVGETGSGKTTQLPKMALELALAEGRQGMVGCTQPRRLAATSVAKRVAEELRVQPGAEVGYEVRFDKRTSEETQVKFMTDGILLAELQGDRFLKKYHTIIIDEAHERSLNIDFLLGILKQLLAKRRDLRVLISSATLDAGSFSEFFSQAPMVMVEGRTFPVEDYFLPPLEREYLADQVVRGVEWVDAYDRNGDVLVFLPGEREIREAAQAVEDRGFRNTEVLPVFARLSMGDQQRVFAPSRKRRIVLATNVAETSLTIPGIVYVIDSGLARVSRWSPQRGIQRLQIEQISQASARQRRGRCGRVREGVCVKLYDELDLEEAAEFTDPEIRRSSLAGVILKMKALGLGEIEDFPFVDPPNGKAIKEGYATLEEVDALHDEGRNGLSEVGWRLAKLPLDPRLGRMLVEAEKRGVLAEILVIVGGLSVMDVRERPEGKEDAARQAQAKFRDSRSDFLSLLKIWNAVSKFRDGKGRFQRNQLRKFCQKSFCNFRRLVEWDQIVGEIARSFCVKKERPETRLASFEVEVGEGKGARNRAAKYYKEIHCALLAGMPRSIGIWDKESKSYKGVGGMKFAIFPGSGLFKEKKRPDWVLAFELVETSRLWARKVAWMQPDWVEEVAPHLCRKRYHSPEWNEGQGAVYGKETILLGGLTIVPGRPVFFGRVSPKAAHEVFVREAILEGRLVKGGGSPPPCLERLAQVRRQCAAAERKLRRVGGLWLEEYAFDFYFARIPVEATTAKAFHQWRKQDGHEDKLMISLRDVVWEEGIESELLLFPDTIEHGGREWLVEYVCDPEAPDDGLVFELELAELPHFPDYLPSWVVPGMLAERVELLIRSLPKDWRTRFQPISQTAEDFLKEWTGWEPQTGLLEALGEFLTGIAGVVIEPKLFDESRLPVSLRPTVTVRDEKGKVLGFSEDVRELKEKLAGLLRSRREAAANEKWEMTGGTYWSFGEVPERAEGVYPALVDEGESVGMRAFLEKEEAAESHRAGVVRLFWMDHEAMLRGFMKRSFLRPLTKLVFGPGQSEALEEQVMRVAVEAAFYKKGAELPRSAGDFAAASEVARGWVLDQARDLAAELERAAEVYDFANRWLAGKGEDKLYVETVADLSEELEWLKRDQFVWKAGARRALRYARHYEALEERLKRLDSLPLAKDEEKRRQLDVLWLDWLKQWRARPEAVRLWEVGWLLAEWRIQLFAPGVPREGKVSEKIIDKALRG
ncbi:ATP-dependent RNA helicase HrpA [Roseibacillus ishigakijimensis]|uniref:ATP-dependent RNA helicase HrpA n=1 Tax=Roseibacillus ishigakijimensis TaxID=454146 RepID=A0A934RUJ0_9BACT|nr:ATP-dependent RNA helicase HrpA [Roseibacillus ishigakijimensis]MBK1834420.1 ATP-dependent RNA helicase HrpA [Roseibacillus ishigakijimensis]